MLPKFSTTILLFNVKICQGWWVLHLNPTVFSENDPTQTWPWRARKMGQDARYRIGVWIVRLDPKTPWKKQGKRWWCNLVRSFLLRKMMMHFQFPKHPPQKKKKLRSFHEFHVISALSDVKQLKLLATGRCWPPASRPCFRLKRSDGEKRGSDGRSSSWVVISWSRKMTPNFSLKICWEQKSLDQYVKHFLVFQK